MEEEEILAAMKAHVARQTSGSNGPAPPDADPRRSSEEDFGAHAAAGNPATLQVEGDSFPLSMEVPSQSTFKPIEPPVDRGALAQASAELEALQSRVGQLNPRNPGIASTLIQERTKKQCGGPCPGTPARYRLSMRLSTGLFMPTPKLYFLYKIV
jgi:hypothetical protein